MNKLKMMTVTITASLAGAAFAAGAIERGTFTCYEVKSCIADLQSGHGTNWLGDANWLVCPIEMVEDMRQKRISVKVGVLAYGKHANGSQGFVRLREDMADWNGRTFRRHSAAEILYAMTRAGIRQGRAT